MLKTSHLSVSYGKKTVLRDASICLEKGKVVSLIGVNGCGKSTLLKTIVGIIKPNCGDIVLNDASALTMNQQMLAKHISYLPQGRTVPDMTVYQMVLHGRFPHLCYPRRYTVRDREIAREMMQRVGIEDLAQHPLSELSGGMRQSVYIAMAMAQQSEFVLLDEPTTYLDVSHRMDLMKMLRMLADEGRGVLCVMHDLPLAFDFSDEIVLLHEGRVVLQGAPCEVYHSPLIREIFGVILKRDEGTGEYFCHFKE